VDEALLRDAKAGFSAVKAPHYAVLFDFLLHLVKITVFL